MYPVGPLQRIIRRKAAALAERDPRAESKNCAGLFTLSVACHLGMRGLEAILALEPSAVIGEHAADSISVALGLHPSAVWPEWYDIAECEAALHAELVAA